ncbi:MAG: hypothetical protein KJO07_16715, partial [Deltaproteobacteria bacterium]|nr:hypothetical protein [Deltaproteobacteria bacterium]
MTQRLAALALAIAIGCGGSTPPPESPEPQTEEPTEAPTTDEAPAQPAAADDYKPQQVCEHMATLIARENAKEGA